MSTCGDCRYISSIETQKGQIDYICKRHPPQVVAGREEDNGRIQVLSRWPMVRKYDVACGEFWGRNDVSPL